MERDVQYAQKYANEINKYFEKNYARKCPIWYLPHFGVETAHKAGKLRTILDATAIEKGVPFIHYCSRVLNKPNHYLEFFSSSVKVR